VTAQRSTDATKRLEKSSTENNQKRLSRIDPPSNISLFGNQFSLSTRSLDHLFAGGRALRPVAPIFCLTTNVSGLDVIEPRGLRTKRLIETVYLPG
jgi:hypothetical protein